MQNKVQILSTAPLDESLINKVKEAGMHIDVLNFIETIPILNEKTIQLIIQLYSEQHTAIFTSVNAVQYLPEYNAQPNWKIYCIGHATRKAAANKFGENLIAGTADNAAKLADEIIKGGIKTILFFCGDKRRDELSEKLGEANIKVKELVVYATILKPQKVNEKYDGILFFSPSAVESFSSMNQQPATTKLFAIGSTTAGAIENMTNNEVITSPVPDKKELIATMLSYYESVLNSK